MRVVIFGATGMVGQGVLRECLVADDVDAVLVVGRTALGQRHPKLREVVHHDFTDLSAIKDALTGYDTCFYCLGISAAGRSEADYTRVTYDFTLAAARTLAELDPQTTFIYVSGAGTDSSEQGATMWARVKGRTENAVLALLPNGYAMRPAFIQPLHGITSKTRLYRIGYVVTTPLFPVLRRLLPAYVTTTEQLGLAMLRVAREGSAKRVLENSDLS